MEKKKIIKYIVLGLVYALLVVISLAAFAGAIQQWPRAMTLRQTIETSIQIIFACLSLCVVVFNYFFRKIAKYIRIAWGVSFVSTAVLSALVWGPPMVLPVLVLGIASALVSIGILFVINRFGSM